MNAATIYLASQSPRRCELLQQLGMQYQVLLLKDDPRGLSEVDESPLAQENPQQYVQRVCLDKLNAAWASAVYRQLPPLPVLAADTTVVLHGRIIGKPANRNDAAQILRALSGSTHQVLTAVAMRLHAKIEWKLSVTAVSFAALDELRIARYLATGEADDKAGAYGIQGLAAAFVTQIAGSYSGVVGLPLFETAELLKTFGYDIP